VKRLRNNDKTHGKIKDYMKKKDKNEEKERSIKNNMNADEISYSGMSLRSRGSILQDTPLPKREISKKCIKFNQNSSKSPKLRK
jgi:hypothetical protein